MKKLSLGVIVLVALVVLFFPSKAFGYNDSGYPYPLISSCRDVCYEDKYGLCKDNCTSYAAYMLNLYGVEFNNSYEGASWHDAGNWNDAAGNVVGENIVVDNNPLPGDVAYWEFNWTGKPNYTGDDHGHVAWVPKVYYDSHGNVTGIDVTEYNYVNKCGFGDRSEMVCPDETG